MEHELQGTKNIEEGYEMKIAAIIQARLHSERYPSKVMMDIHGKIMLRRVIDRVRIAIDDVIVATPDMLIAFSASEAGAKFYFGSEDDVLERYYQAAQRAKLTDVIRVTADNPLFDPFLLKEMLETYSSSDVDYLSNNLPRTFPMGLDIEIFKFKALEKAHYEAKTKYEREHVTPYIRNHPDLFKLKNCFHKPDLSELRWTVDYPEDLEFVREVYSKLGDNFTMNDVLKISARRVTA